VGTHKDGPSTHTDVILRCNIDKAFSDPLLDLALPYIAPVRGRPEDVSEGLVDGMGYASEDHAAMVPPQPVCGSGH